MTDPNQDPKTPTHATSPKPSTPKPKAAPKFGAPATKAERAGITLPWTPFAHDVPEPKRNAAFQKPMAMKLGVFRPVSVYPFYEAATSAHWGQTPRQALAESGALWATYSLAATQNPTSWLKRRFTPEEITTPTSDNRLIAWPYTKLMVANPMVNMGGAVLMTSLAKARAAGVREDRLIHISGGASAQDPRDILGLGAASHVEWVEVRWPAPSTRVEKFSGLKPNRYSTIVEGEGERVAGP